eukprot:4599668-Prymnesium_polylepis.1
MRGSAAWMRVTAFGASTSCSVRGSHPSSHGCCAAGGGSGCVLGMLHRCENGAVARCSTAL